MTAKWTTTRRMTTEGTASDRTTARAFPTVLAQALRERVLSLMDTSRPEGPAFLAAAAGTEVAKATGIGRWRSSASAHRPGGADHRSA